MQILEDNIEDFGDIAKRIQALREQVEILLANNSKQNSVVSSKENNELVLEISMLKKQLAAKEDTIQKNKLAQNASVDNDEKNKSLVLEITSLKKQLADKEKTILENKNNTLDTSSSVDNNEVLQENILLKKQLKEREKTIKELDFKLEMFKLAKTLREGSGIGSKSEELKQMITEYIKEIDKSITSLNIE